MTSTTTALNRSVLAFVIAGATILLAVTIMLPFQAHAALLTQQLDFGESNSDVTSLQTFLAAMVSIYPEGIISGYFGNLTASAVSRFQTANELPAVGRVGPLTLALINTQMGGGTGGSDDVWAPVMNPETVSTGPHSVTVSWTTSEAAQSRVMYGTTWPFLYSTAPSVGTNGYGSTASLTFSGLQSNTRYYYVRESIDVSGNIMWTSAKSVVTN